MGSTSQLSIRPAHGSSLPNGWGSPSASTKSKPILRDLKTKLEQFDDDLEIEDLPDEFGRDLRR